MFNEFFSFRTPEYLKQYNKYFKVANSTNHQLPITQLVNMELPIFSSYVDGDIKEAKEIYSLEQSPYSQMNNDI